MYINDFPVFQSSCKTEYGSPDSVFRFFKNKRTVFYYGGRQAVWNGVKLLNPTPGDNILVPSYHCGVEIDAVVKAGFMVKFYAVRNSGKVDPEDIRKKIDQKTRAVFIIHYFGFPQEIDEISKICKANRLFLIEDCAHALLSSRDHKEIGTFGDISIFSIRKSLPVPDGGALVINDPDIGCAGLRKPCSPAAITVLKEAIKIKLSVIKSRNVVLYRLLDSILVRPFIFLKRFMTKKHSLDSGKEKQANYRDFNVGSADLGMSGLTQRIMSSMSIAEIIERRRENYRFLLSALSRTKGFSILNQDLPSSVCPLFFPVLVEQRDEVFEKLLDRGVAAFIFGKIPHCSMKQDEFPPAHILAQRNLCLPVHQDLAERHMKFIAETFKQIVSI